MGCQHIWLGLSTIPRLYLQFVLDLLGSQLPEIADALFPLHKSNIGSYENQRIKCVQKPSCRQVGENHLVYHVFHRLIFLDVQGGYDCDQRLD